MKVVIRTLDEFDRYVGFWGGARGVWDSLTLMEKAEVEELVESCELEFDSLTQINDFVWFELRDILEEE